MTKLPIGSTTSLPAGALFLLDRHVSQWIEVHEGAVWITRPDDPRDLILEEGDSYVIDDPSGVIVGAIGGPAVVWADETQDHALAA